MLFARTATLIAAAALASAVASSAAAADAPKSKPIDFTVRQEASSAPFGLKILKWDARKGRWGLTLNLDQSDVRPSTANDVQAGAYYKLTPSLKVGGAVALGEQRIAPGPKKPGAEEGQPRVRLETIFKF